MELRMTSTRHKRLANGAELVKIRSLAPQRCDVRLPRARPQGYARTHLYDHVPASPSSHRAALNETSDPFDLIKGPADGDRVAQ